MMQAPVRIPLALVYPNDHGRVVQADKVEVIAESMQAIGLRTPITVRPVVKVADGRDIDAYEIVAGRHRYEAALRLHWKEVDAFVADADETQARLWEIAENLHRAELTVQERSDMVAEWVELTNGGFSGASCATKPGHGQGAQGGVRAASRELGIDRTQVQRAVKIASITDEAKEAARDAGLDDNQSALLTIAKAEPERQVEVARDLAAAKAERRSRRETNTAFDKMTKDDATEQLASLLAEQLPGEHWTTCTALLYAAGCANVAKALNRLTGAPVFDNTKAGRAA